MIPIYSRLTNPSRYGNGQSLVRLHAEHPAGGAMVSDDDHKYGFMRIKYFHSWGHVYL
jgi:hypothetical protein